MKEKKTMKVILAQPRGFCAGVDRAITIVDQAAEFYDAPIYMRHEIVHNQRVVQDLRAKGVRFVDKLDQVPDGSIAIFSAHGVSSKVIQKAKDRNLQSIDATCPLVTKVHKQGQHYERKDYDIILIGHKDHPEVEGTLGQIKGHVLLVSEVTDIETLEVRNPDKVAYITQTTLSVDDTRNIIQALQKRFPKIIGPNTKDICYATQNRQAAVRKLAAQVDLILVVGAHNSSNSNRLCEVGRDSGVPSYLVEEPDQVEPTWWEGKETIGITAGASTPDELVQELLAILRDYMEIELSTMDGEQENVYFPLPLSLQKEREARETQATDS